MTHGSISRAPLLLFMDEAECRLTILQNVQLVVLFLLIQRISKQVYVMRVIFDYQDSCEGPRKGTRITIAPRPRMKLVASRILKNNYRPSVERAPRQIEL